MTSVLRESSDMERYRNQALKKARGGDFSPTKVSVAGSVGGGWLKVPSYAWDIFRMVLNSITWGGIGNMGYLGGYEGEITAKKKPGCSVTLTFKLKNVTHVDSGHLPLAPTNIGTNSKPYKTHRDHTQNWLWEEDHSLNLPFDGLPPMRPYL
jgi:hypothetical protein